MSSSVRLSVVCLSVCEIVRCARENVQSTCSTRPAVYSDAQFDFLVRTMTNFETRHMVEQIKSHAADLSNVASLVWFRQSTHDHVRISNCLHLTSKQSMSKSHIFVRFVKTIKRNYNDIRDCSQLSIFSIKINKDSSYSDLPLSSIL